MDLKLTQENLNKALNIVSRIASSRTTLPILGNILLKTVKNHLQISSTNLDIAVTEFVGAKVQTNGSITVPARLFQDFIASLPAGTVSLKQDKNKLFVNTDNHESTFNGIDSEEFPVIPEIKEKQQWEIDSKELKEALNQVIIAVSADEARPVLTGVAFVSKKDKLFVAATDSYRLAEKTLNSPKEDIKLLLPGNAAQELLRIVNEDNGPVVVTYDGQQARFKTERTELIARLIDGEYPDYQKLIPVKFACSATLNKKEFQNIVKVSSLFARESAGSIILSADKEKKEVHVNSVASQVGENSSSAKANKVTSNGEITLNSRYLLEALQVINGDEVEVSFNGKLEPLLIKSPSDKSYIHIIMPLKS